MKSTTNEPHVRVGGPGEPLRPGERYVFVGRPSPLGNPFRQTDPDVGSKGLAVAMYEDWLWEHLERGDGSVVDAFAMLLKLLEEGEKVVLGCPCRERPCHAEVLTAALLACLGEAGDKMGK